MRKILQSMAVRARPAARGVGHVRAGIRPGPRPSGRRNSTRCWRRWRSTRISLLSQVLMASTYPLEVVQAARWSRANPGLKGQDAVRAVEPMDWDPSVKSLTAFPQILTLMDEKLDWTEQLGEAFLAQQARRHGHGAGACAGAPRRRATSAPARRCRSRARARSSPSAARARNRLRAVLRPGRGLRLVVVAGLSSRLLGPAAGVLRRPRAPAGLPLGPRYLDLGELLLRPARLAPAPRDRRSPYRATSGPGARGRDARRMAARPASSP